MKRQYIAITANGSSNSGLKHTIAEATKWAEDFLGKNNAFLGKNNIAAYICETVAVAHRAPTPVTVTDIPKDDFDADKITSKDVQDQASAEIPKGGLSKPVPVDDFNAGAIKPADVQLMKKESEDGFTDKVNAFLKGNAPPTPTKVASTLR